MSNLISVIVPIYKVETYIHTCIQSILNQTYKNLEIILIDDGSPDNCGKICDEYKLLDSRIKVIHKNNGGLSEARNYGINAASGDYLLFIDSDDYIETTMCEILLSNALKFNTDITICNFYYTHPNKKQLNHTSSNKSIQLLNNIEALQEYFLNYSVDLNVAWNKLYKRHLFIGKNSIKFPVGKLYEDTYIMYKLFYISKKILRLNIPLYYYTQRDNSITSKVSKKNISDILNYIHEYYFFSEDKNSNIKYMIQLFALKQYTGCISISIKHNILNEVISLFNDMRPVILKHSNTIPTNPYITSKTKKYYYLLKLNLLITYKNWEFKLKNFHKQGGSFE